MIKKTFYYLVLACLLAVSGTAQVTLIDDINTSGTGDSNPFGFTEFNDKLYFQAEAVLGMELYEYDGLTSPRLAKDINTGTSDGEESSNPSQLIVFRGKLYFSALTTTQGVELCSYDSSGNFQVLEVLSADESTNPMDMIEFNGKMYFSGLTSSGPNTKLYGYSGAYSPNLIRNASDETFEHPVFVGVYNDKLYFHSMNTETGVTKFLSIDTLNNIAEISGINNPMPPKGVVFRNKMYFSTGSGFVSFDGTNNTVLSIFDNHLFMSDLIVFDDAIFFAAHHTTDTKGVELYKYDGTTISLVKDINPSGHSKPDNFTIYNGKLYFSAEEPSHGKELYSYNPLNDSVELVADIYDGTMGSDIKDITVFKNKLYVSASAGSSTGVELYRLDANGRPTSVFERISLNKLTIRQNGENVFISNQNGADLKSNYKVYDVQGKVIQMGVLGRKELTIDKTQLSKGLYMVSIQNQTIKFVVE